MGKLSFEKTPIEGLMLITPFFAPDDRGRFEKVFEAKEFAEHGIVFDIKEVTASVSKKGVIRGLHFQYRNAQAKLVHCTDGAIFDVAVDLRRDSPTFGKWAGYELSAENGRALYIPRGFAHGFAALAENSRLEYYSDNYYYPECDGGIIWRDSGIGVAWPPEVLKDGMIVSAKDAALESFAAFKRTKGYVE